MYVLRSEERSQEIIMKNGLNYISITLIALMMALSIGSCKKENETTITHQLQQSWNVTSIKTNYHSALGDSINIYHGIQNDTFQFKNDGKLISIIDGDTTVTNYSIISNSRLQIDNEYYSIHNFTYNSLVLYAKEGVPEAYFEVTVSLKK